MVLRVSSQQVFNQGVNSLTNLFGQTADTQARLSSGQRILNPSDDPVASARILQLDQERAITSQYVKNIDSANSRLFLEDAHLQSVTDIMARIRQLAIQAGGVAVSLSDRQSIATELRERQQELLGIFNTRDGDGEFMFAGFQGDQQPFVETLSGDFEYVGDEGQRFSQISASTTLAVSDSGKALFVDIDSAQNTFTTTANPNNTAQPPASINNGLVIDQAVYDTFYPEDFIIRFNDPAAVAPAQANYTITQKSDGRVVAANQLYTSGDPIEFNGLRVAISGNPAQNDSFIVESSTKQDVLTTVGRLIEGLETLGDSDSREQLIADALNNIGNIEDHIGTAQSVVGGRLNTLEDTRGSLEAVDVINESLLRDLRDLDFAEAISLLSFQTFVLEAAQQSYASISRLSLFDYF